MVTKLCPVHGACVMGIINVTPDSFSGDGLGRSTDMVSDALDQAERMIEAGAVWLDIGGESSRPGSVRVAQDVEIARTMPVIRALLDRWPDLLLSLDTTKPDVAALGVEAGVRLINDISGKAADPALYRLARERNVGLVLMHNQASAQAVSQAGLLGASYDSPDPQGDVVDCVLSDLQDQIAAALSHGVDPHQLILDPGLGFGKTVAQNLHLVRHLDRIVGMGYPVLLAPSRKNFIGQVLDLPPEDRMEGTAAIVALGTFMGAKILRVHDVKEMARVVKMVNAVQKG